MSPRRVRQPAPPQIDVTIDELVLHGFAPADRYAIGEALQRELTHLLLAQGLPPGGAYNREMSRVNGGAFQPGTRATPDTLGAQIAASTQRGIAHALRSEEPQA